MSEVSQGPGWWQASDLKWYPPELHADYVAPTAPHTDSAASPKAATRTYSAPAPTHARHAHAATRHDEGSVWSTQSRVRSSWAGLTSHCRPLGWAFLFLGSGLVSAPGRCRDRDHRRDDRGPVGSVSRTHRVMFVVARANRGRGAAGL